MLKGAPWYTRTGRERPLSGLWGRANRGLNVPARKKINLLHLSTLVAVCILVGTEMVGASWAAGWALGGLLQLDPVISRIFEGFFALCGFLLLFYFMRTAIKNESIRE
ncbi:MAG TPA: hypothetical protein VKA03_00825 [Methylovirgula sp.]|nr:hypothetical protein [Methylovirgula sp.]